jgi:hypothetical protein
MLAQTMGHNTSNITQVGKLYKKERMVKEEVSL